MISDMGPENVQLSRVTSVVHISTFLGSLEFFREGEALFFGRKDMEFTNNVTEVLGEELSRNPITPKTLFQPLRIPGEVALEIAEHELGLISSTPKELPSTSISSRFSNISN